jgi:hypothetical protein
MMPLDMANQQCAEGQVLLFTSGKYAEEKPRFLGRARRAFAMRDAVAAFRGHVGDQLPTWELFVTWLLREGYIEPLEHVEVHVESHWGERDVIEMLPLAGQAEVVDMVAGKACPRCASRHVLPATRDGHVDLSRRRCADCGFVYDVPEAAPA